HVREDIYRECARGRCVRCSYSPKQPVSHVPVELFSPLLLGIAVVVGHIDGTAAVIVHEGQRTVVVVALSGGWRLYLDGVKSARNVVVVLASACTLYRC